MTRAPLYALTVAAIVATSALMAGQARAADEIIVAPRAGQTVVAPTQSYVVVPNHTYVQPSNSVVVWDEDQTRESEVVLETPDGRTFKTTARYRPDGTMILPIEDRTLPAGTVVRQVVYQPAQQVYYQEVYRVYDCGIINSNAEWAACGLEPQE